MMRVTINIKMLAKGANKAHKKYSSPVLLSYIDRYRFYKSTTPCTL